MRGAKENREKSGREVGRHKHGQKENQQDAESIFEIDKLSRGGGEGKRAVPAFRETVRFLLAVKAGAGEKERRVLW